MDGIVLINKEKNCTSRDVVNQVIKILKTKKIGHTGTLDPIATGVLVLCIGKATKLVEVITTEEETHEEETDDEENTEDGEPTPILFSVMLAEAADTQYTVELRNESNDVLENINLSSGNVKDEFSKVYATGYEKEGKNILLKKQELLNQKV